MSVTNGYIAELLQVRIETLVGAPSATDANKQMRLGYDRALRDMAEFVHARGEADD